MLVTDCLTITWHSAETLGLLMLVQVIIVVPTPWT